ncbi:MAG: Nif3-like dinuclear metal center hexameric protein [Calditrichaeota bacterium]|nr:Nif3-like dinuclear metal center hexameric protein [Calditrichota bacterium]
MKRNDLEKYLNNLLDLEKYHDMCPNGLQVEGRPEIKKIVTGVSACVELFEEALARNADAVLTHHGVIWNFEKPLYKGGYKKRIKLLLENDVNLFGYHLPLDGDPAFGNNALIANLLNVQDVQPFDEYKGAYIGCSGSFDNLPPEQLFELVKKEINPDAQFFPFGPEKINSIGIISGGAQKEIKEAVLQGLDVFLTGEASEHIYHYAKEEGIHFIAAGHHATEVFGVQALGKHIREKFGIEVEFVNIHNPI